MSGRGAVAGSPPFACLVGRLPAVTPDAAPGQCIAVCPLRAQELDSRPKATLITCS